MAVSEFGALTRGFDLCKSGYGKIMAVSEFGRLWRGDITRFYCMSLSFYQKLKCLLIITCMRQCVELTI